MRKTDKKIDNKLRVVLTHICEHTLKQIDGFEWVTHTVNYSNFPQSLKIVCVFDSDETLNAFSVSDDKKRISALIHRELTNIGVNVKNVANHICYDTEENCAKEHNGNWVNRLG